MKLLDLFCGAGGCSEGYRRAGFTDITEAMGIDWMTRKELSQAIPPAYTEWIGKRIIEGLC